MSAQPAARVADRDPTSGRICSAGVDVPETRINALRDALKGAIEGEVRFSIGDRALYAADASNYRQIPYGVVTTGLHKKSPCSVEQGL